MPLFEDSIPYEDMQTLVKAGEVCGECGGLLVVAWSAARNCYMLRCGNVLEHNTITRHRKLSKVEKELQKEYRRLHEMDSRSLMTMPENKMLERISMAKFPKDLLPAERKLLAEVAITYGFDPLMGEITIYQGRPWVSIDGRYRKAQETGNLDGVQSRPATKEEREAWQIPAGDYFFRAEVYVKGSAHPFVAWGRVLTAETAITTPGDVYKPVVKNPQRMAEKRAEAQALRKAFHIPLPSVEDIGSDYDIESTAVDKGTGEITDPKPQPATASTPVVTPDTGITGTTGTTYQPGNEFDIEIGLTMNTIRTLRWAEPLVRQHLQAKYQVDLKGSLETVLKRLSPEQFKDFQAEVANREALK